MVTHVRECVAVPATQEVCVCVCVCVCVLIKGHCKRTQRVCANSLMLTLQLVFVRLVVPLQRVVVTGPTPIQMTGNADGNL